MTTTMIPTMTMNPMMHGHMTAPSVVDTLRTPSLRVTPSGTR